MLCAFIANYYLKINIVLIILICIILAAAKPLSQSGGEVTNDLFTIILKLSADRSI